MKAWLLKNKFLATLLILLVGQFFFISPLGEFPLNDDWVHAEMVQHWSDTGLFRLNPYVGPLLYTQLIYGTALSKIFGFSFTLLRFSSLALMGGLVIGLFLWLKKQTNNEPLAFFSALLIWLNPIAYSLSFTFMTDVPALAVLFFSIAAFYTGASKQKTTYFWLGGLLAAAGFFIRQTTILILPAAGVLWLIQKPIRKLKFLLPIVIPGLTAVAIYYWLGQHNLIGEGTSYHEIENKTELLKHALWWGVYTMLYLGLFLLPLSISLFKKVKTWWYLNFGALGTTFSLWLWLRRHESFPYVGNTINHFGLGPYTDVLSGTFVPLFPSAVWITTSLLAGFGAGLLTFIIGQWLITKKTYQSKHFFILFFALIFTAPILYVTSFDRYFLPLTLAGIIMLNLEFKNNKPHWLSWSLLLIMAGYTLTQTQFYLNWNRVRAELVTSAFTDHGAKIDTLDSGYEWTGYYDYWLATQEPKNYRWPAGSPWWVKNLMININRDQVITASPLPNYHTVETRTVWGLNPNHTLYLQQKNDVSDQK